MKKFLLVFLLLVSCNSAQSRRLAQEKLAVYPWQFVTPMPHGRYGHDAVYADNGKIYVMGGIVFKVAKGFSKDKKFDSWLIKKFNNGWYSNLAYDTQKKEWEYMTLIPGWAISEFISIFDPNRDYWRDQWREYRGSLDNYTEEELRKLCRPPEPNGKPLRVYNTNLDRFGNGLAITLSVNTIFWTGGQNFGGGIENIALPYDLTTDKWPKDVFKKMVSKSPKPFWEYDQREMYQTDIPPMQEPRRDHRAVTTADGRIYVLGGWHEEKIGVNPEKGTFLKKVDVVSKTMECYDSKTNKWEYKKPLSRERMVFAAAVGKDDKIYVFGGAAGMSDDPKTPILNTVEIYDPKTDSWSFGKSMPAPRFFHAAVLGTDGRIYVMGGAETHDDILASVLIYDPEKDSWENGPDMILPRASPAAAATPDGKIYAIGGTDVEAYENKAQWQHLVDLFSSAELGDYNGKVQDSVEVLNIYKWKKAKEKK